MKLPHLLLVLALPAVFFSGWKTAASGMNRNLPEPTQNSAKAGSSNSAFAESIQRQKERIKAPEKMESPFGLQYNDKDKARSLAIEYRDSMTLRKGTSDDLRIAKFVELLGLDSNQAAKLAAYCAEQVKLIEEICENSSEYGPDMNQLAIQMNEPIPDSVFMEILSSEQATEYHKMKEVERAKVANIQALQDYAAFSEIVRLTPEQQAQPEIFQAFLKNTEALPDINDDSAEWDVTPMGTAGANQRITTIYRTNVLGPTKGLPEDAAEASAILEDRRNEYIDFQTEMVAPFLDENQKLQYREYLKNRQHGYERTIVTP